MLSSLRIRVGLQECLGLSDAALTEAEEAIPAAGNLAVLKILKSHFLGIEGRVSVLIWDLPYMKSDDRVTAGESINNTTKAIQALIAKQEEALNE
jgi:hypothetical protein